MIITATDFQLSVNEYFTKLMQGESIIIERYGKKFSVLIPYEQYEDFVQWRKSVANNDTQPPSTEAKITRKENANELTSEPNSLEATPPGNYVPLENTTGLSAAEVAKLLRILLASSSL